MTGRFRIERIEARILDIPTIRPHRLSFGAISRQSPVIVQLWLGNGASGFGEAATAVNNAAVVIDPSAHVFPGHSSEGS